MQHHRADRERGEHQEHHSGEPLPAALARLHRRQRLTLPHLGDEPVALAGQSCDVAVLAALLAEELRSAEIDLREAVLFDTAPGQIALSSVSLSSGWPACSTR